MTCTVRTKAMRRTWRTGSRTTWLGAWTTTLGPKLAGGKVHVWVGDADDYFLNNAVHRLKGMLARQSSPRFDGQILIDMRQPHTSGGWTEEGMLDEMATRAGVR